MNSNVKIRDQTTEFENDFEKFKRIIRKYMPSKEQEMLRIYSPLFCKDDEEIALMERLQELRDKIYVLCDRIG